MCQLSTASPQSNICTSTYSTCQAINGDLFPENVKQSLVVKSKSRFEQPGEREGEDAIRVALIERGGKEVGSAWLPLP